MYIGKYSYVPQLVLGQLPHLGTIPHQIKNKAQLLPARDLNR